MSREREFMDMVDEFRALGEQAFVDEDVLVNEGFTKYVEWLAKGKLGEIEGLDPWSAFWAFDADTNELVGVSSLRHTLSAWMLEYGGHIGYRVRPAMRQKGIGTKILAHTLRCAHAIGIQRVLVVCPVDNEGSKGVLRKNGAIYERDVQVDGTQLHRYWINLTSVNSGDDQ